MTAPSSAPVMPVPPPVVVHVEFPRRPSSTRPVRPVRCGWPDAAVLGKLSVVTADAAAQVHTDEETEALWWAQAAFADLANGNRVAAAHAFRQAAQAVKP
ncbi:hypothetical protein EOD42_16660 [Rhodovarius crocodyli]|uniref:Uncharacterized protein n=1 Tax=Rhodovarius crocodyli TaxID=1979269 RepID=A0A437MC39_9PROT|nr:hypothetical protein [Rhodovarius crocodyli]RVT95216.1 hypothetical protein EOD42_16660 [Rhodovarius crocodyli]